MQGMHGKPFVFDLGRIMDEAFRWAQGVGEAFQQGVDEMFPGAEEMREKFRQHFKWPGYSDVYPQYNYPPVNIYLTREKNLVFEFALAGFEEKSIDLQFRGDYLYFSARAPVSAEPEGEVQYFKHRLKLRDIEEQRYFVPEDKFDHSQVEARFRNGLLRVVVHARNEQARKEGVRVNIVSDDASAEGPEAGGTASGGPSPGGPAAA